MDISKQYKEQQKAKQLQGSIYSFVDDFKAGSLLNIDGTRIISDVSPLRLFAVIFTLPIEGVSLAQGIVTNQTLSFIKDAAYNFLKNPRLNRRTFMLSLTIMVVRFFDVLTDEKRERVLIFDDSSYDRSHSKLVEMLAWIYDHNRGLSIKGFKLMTLGWSDENSFLPIDLVLCPSAKAYKRLQGIKKKLDKCTCRHKRRHEDMTKSIKHLGTMDKPLLRRDI